MEIHAAKKTIVMLYHRIYSIFWMFWEDRCPSKAAGLSYTSLLAVVPFSTFLFSLFTAFGVFTEELLSFRDFLVELLMPTRQEELLSMFEGFLSNSMKLGVSGLIIFVFTSIFLLDTITGAFNSLWGSKSSRPLTAKFSAYIALVVIGSLLISSAISITGGIRLLLPDESIRQVNLLLRLPIRLIPFIFSFMLMFILYKLIPDSYVQTRSAMLGSFWAALLIEISRFWFLKIANTFIRISVIYGSLAAIPVFLFWLYVLWLFALLGLEIAFAHQFHITHPAKHPYVNSDPAGRISTGLDVYLAIANSYGGKLPDEKRLVKQFRLSPEILGNYISTFMNSGLLIEVQPKGRFFSSRWVPGKPLDEIPVNQLLDILINTKGKHHPAVDEFFAAGKKALEGKTVRDLLAERES